MALDATRLWVALLSSAPTLVVAFIAVTTRLKGIPWVVGLLLCLLALASVYIFVVLRFIRQGHHPNIVLLTWGTLQVVFWGLTWVLIEYLT